MSDLGSLFLEVAHLSRSEQEPQGDILAFLTGREEIDRCLQALADRQIK